MRGKLLDIVGEQLVRREMFTIDWHFSSRQGLSGRRIVRRGGRSAPFDETYPRLAEPVSASRAIVASRETVLILQGPPGTGKTRLVRCLLAAMSTRKGR